MPPQEAKSFCLAVQERQKAVRISIEREQQAEQAKMRKTALAELEKAQIELSNDKSLFGTGCPVFKFA